MTIQKRGLSQGEKHALWEGLLFVSPWLIGFVCFLLIPLVVSIGISLTNYNFLNVTRFVGLNNYIKLLCEDELVWHSLRITLIYAMVAVPAQLLFGFMLALLLNMPLKGVSVYRTIFYIPCLVVSVAASLLWRQMLNTDFGVINYLLSLLGISRISWLGSTSTIMVSLVMISLWSVGRAMIINLSGLQAIPTHLYEASEIDGCGKIRQVFAITVPMMTPTIFLNLITGIIGAFKMFTMVKILTDGGPNNASKFYMLYLYENAFKNYRLGYASAMSWLLFVIVAALTLVVFRTSNSWVHYEGGVDK